MKLLTNILAFTLLPLALFASLPPTAEDLREMRAIVDSPVLNQILSPDEGVFFIGKDQEETERSVYILESAAHTIGVVVNHEQPATQKPGFVGPLPIELQFYAIPNEETTLGSRGSTFRETFDSVEPVVAEEGGSPSQDPDLVRMREILNSSDLYSEVDGTRMEYIVRSPLLNVEEMRNDLAQEQNLDEKAMALKNALDKASLEKSEVYLIIAKQMRNDAQLQLLAFVLYPEDSETTTPTIIFFKVPNDEEAGE